MLDKILEYQTVETELIALETEVSKSKDREKASEIQQNLKNQHAKLLALENSAKVVGEQYKKATEKYEEYLKKLEKLEEEVKNADPEKAELYAKMYKDFATVSANLERDIQNIHASVQQISRDYEDIIRKSKFDRERFDKFKASYSKLKAEKEPQIEATKAKLEALAKSIDPKLMSIYRQKREGRIFPVFVALAVNKCGGCRMEISASKLGQMKTNNLGVIECENCGRLIYQK